MSRIGELFLDEKERFEGKNAWLSQYFEEVTPLEFYRELFPVGSFERKGIYEDRKGNGILVKIVTEGEKKHAYRSTVTDDLDKIKETIDNCSNEDFCILSPVSYAGLQRNAKNARYLYALAFDIDSVEVDNLADMFHQMNNGILPTPTFIVNSGHGAHLYYQFENPVPMYPAYQKALRDIKYALTPRLWNAYTSNDENVQFQSIVQGFRLVGTSTKLGFTTKAFRCGKKITVEELCSFIPEKTFEIRGLDDVKRMTLKEAKEKYPEWYQERVIEKKPRKRWVNKRALYDWWKRKILTDITFGHRYFSIMVLAIYGKKCDIPFDEVEDDAYSFLHHLDSLTVNIGEEFRVEDINAALQAYNDNYITFPRDSIKKLTKVDMPKNKRNGRSREEHIKLMNFIRDELNKNKTWNKVGNGRKPKMEVVKEWRMENPKGTKAQCIKDTGLSKPTVYKWWKYSLEDSFLVIEAEDRIIKNKQSKRISQSEVDAKFGFNVLDLSKTDDIELE